MRRLPELFVEFDPTSNYSMREQYDHIKDIQNIGIKLNLNQLLPASRSSLSKYNSHPLFFDYRMNHSLQVMLDMVEFAAEFNTFLISIDTMADAYVNEIVEKANAHNIQVIGTTVDVFHDSNYSNRYFGMNMLNSISLLLYRASELHAQGYIIPGSFLESTKEIREKAGGFAFCMDVCPTWFTRYDAVTRSNTSTPAEVKKHGAVSMSCSKPIFCSNHTPAEALQKIKDELEGTRTSRTRRR